MSKKQKSGLKRNCIDKFYTSEKTVDFCFNLLKNHANIKKDDLIIEPSAGNGSFISIIKKY